MQDRDLKDNRWSEEEHARFMEGLERFGKDWKKISEVIITRNHK